MEFRVAISGNLPAYPGQPGYLSLQQAHIGFSRCECSKNHAVIAMTLCSLSHSIENVQPARDVRAACQNWGRRFGIYFHDMNRKPSARFLPGLEAGRPIRSAVPASELVNALMPQ